MNPGLARWQAQRRLDAADEMPSQSQPSHHDLLSDAISSLGALREAENRRKQLMRIRTAERRLRELRQRPAWADQTAISSIYAEAVALTARTGIAHHVDHCIPLKGRLVSGLHVAENLRAVPWIDNLRKSNRHDPGET